MFDQLKRLGSDTAVYGLSTILGRFLNFLLVPFYTNVLVPGDYGIVAYVYSLIAFVNVLYAYGMESAYFKYASSLERGSPEDNFSTPFWSIAGSSGLFSAAIVLAASPIAGLIHLPEQFTAALYCTAGILAFDALAIVPFGALRLERRSRLFAAIKFLNIAITVALNLVLLLVFHMGVLGIFVSGLAASAVTFLLLVPTIRRHLVFRVDRTLWRSLLVFALPGVPAGLAAMTMQVIDRPILRSLTSDEVVGVYQANYRLGIFMMLVVQMFDYAWRPFYFTTAKEPNAREIFARVLTYLVLAMAGIFVVLTFFLRDLVTLDLFGRHIIAPAYWGGLDIIPVVLLGYVFLGVATNMSAGLYIEKRTALVPVGTFAGAAVNVVANFLLIPRLGMMGAAWATLLAYAAMALTVYVLVERVYPVQYEFGRIGKIALATAVVLVLASFWTPESALVAFLEKLALVGLFAGLMVAMKFFDERELTFLQRVVRLAKPTGGGERGG
jgi:O-antigen/teichoic acid export membrane protein